MSEWNECKLGDIATITDCEHKTAPLVESSEFISVRTSNIQNGKIDFENSNRVSSEVYEEWTKRLKPNVGDIVLAREAPVGEVGWIPKGKKVCLGQRTVLIRTTDKLINPKYLLYYLVNDEVKNDLINRSTGSVVEHLNVKDIKNFDLRIHKLLEKQCTIASVLSSLDDKIDLLHRQNATLGAMAETLFRQWFVEEAKEDWEEGKLSDLVVVKYGKDHKKLLDGKIPVYGSGGIMRYADKALYDKESVLIPRKGTLSNVIYIDEPFWSVDTMFYTEMKKQNIAKFIFYFVKGLDLASMNVGSAVPSMTTEVLNNLPIDIPSDAFLEQFEQVLAPLYKKMKSNLIQIRTLTALRDTLLPKLMSGEVRVKM